MTKSRKILPPRRFWTEIELQLLREHYHDSHTVNIAKAIGREPRQVLAKANALGLRKDIDFIAEVARERSTRPDHGGRRTRIQPGTVPWNKGTNFVAGGRSAETRFKPGQMPHTWRPVGSYTVNSDGYLDQKVSDESGPRHLRWKPVHRLVWEAANGPVPEGHVVVFKRGRHSIDPALITLDAVELVTRDELMRRNSVHNLPPELLQVTRLRASLTRAINDRAKEEQ
ncbi:MAG: HNH endonuclease signature motif containing protein [Rubrivivax sp.]